MPPPDQHDRRAKSPRPDRVLAAIEQIRSLDPNLDVRPGSAIRTLVEAAARAGESSPYVDYGTTLRPPTPRHVLASLPSITAPELRRHEMIERGLQQMMAHEDAQVFAALDRAVRNDLNPVRRREDDYLRGWGTQYMGTFANPAAIPNHTPIQNPPNPPDPGPMLNRPGRSSDELEMMVQATSTERVRYPMMPLYSNPTININEVRERRYNVWSERHRSTNPCGEQTLGVTSEMTLEQMNKVALIVRKTAWERLLSVEELEFPV